METMTLTTYAKRIGVSQQRPSQYKRDGLLDGCFTMRGRALIIHVAIADERLRQNIRPALIARPVLTNHPFRTTVEAIEGDLVGIVDSIVGDYPRTDYGGRF